MASSSKAHQLDLDVSDSSDASDDEPLKGKAKGDGKKAAAVKKRSSKACDNCRKSKCRCVRPEGEGQANGPCQNCIAVGVECTYLGATRKRGPPKGYIEAIETRLHRMEALLGGIIRNDDPRAQALLQELIGSEEARDVLTNDLQAAAKSDKPRKSWKKADASAASSSSATSVTKGFLASSNIATPAQDYQQTPRWFTDEELSAQQSAAMPGFSASTTFTDASGNIANPLSLPREEYRNLLDLDDDGPKPSIQPTVTGLDIPVSSAQPGYSISPHSLSASSAAGGPFVSQPADMGLSTSPRQRRRLTGPIVGAGTAALVGGSPAANPTEISKMAFSYAPQTQHLRPGAINHTGTASYTLSSDAPLSSDSAQTGELTELADVVGQLSLNENAEVRYHGRSSGLYLISKSTRFKDFFWQFPSAGVWPPTDGRVLKTEAEILKITGTENALPDRATQQHLLDLYWTYVHPHFPILYKVSFMRQYRHTMSNPSSNEPSTPSGGGKVPTVLLLAMFALAARYSDLDPTRSDGKYWTAGQDYLDAAKKILNFDYGSSKLVSVQTLLLLAYREIGTGAMSASWLFTGMAIRMAQDLGLFRDVDKWFLPVQRFSHEEKQTRKRVWLGCIILDRYTASYIGRPNTIHERDYDTSFPSEDEPDEHEQWRPLRPDGTDWTSASKPDSDELPVDLSNYPACKSHTMSCFNAAGALAVIINRIIVNVYAIRIRVLGQSSETLLSLLDQSLASWYLSLPKHLEFNPMAKKQVPPPHVLALHLQFYSALILLHRPFIPGQSSQVNPSSFPSHSICTTAANAIAKIVKIFSDTFSLRQCPPFLTYPIFSAAIVCVYNAGFDEALARPAKANLLLCMNALKEMEVIWGSAIRQWELLHGLVDLKDLNLQSNDIDAVRGTKRPANDDSAASISPSAFNVAPANFHARPMHQRADKSATRKSSQKRKSSNLSTQSNASATRTQPGSEAPKPQAPQGSLSQAQSLFPVSPTAVPIAAPHPVIPQAAMFNAGHQTYEFLTSSGPALDLSQFRSRPGSPSAPTDYNDLINAFLSPIETAGEHAMRASMAEANAQNHSAAANSSADPSATAHVASPFDTSAFMGMPLAADMNDDWANYLPQAFAFGPGGASPATGGGSLSPESMTGTS